MLDGSMLETDGNVKWQRGGIVETLLPPKGALAGGRLVAVLRAIQTARVRALVLSEPARDGTRVLVPFGLATSHTVRVIIDHIWRGEERESACCVEGG
jgi:hypothetical protein